MENGAAGVGWASMMGSSLAQRAERTRGLRMRRNMRFVMAVAEVSCGKLGRLGAG